MHKVTIPQSVIDRVVARRGSEHCFAGLDPAKTALVVVDMQNAFMLDGVGHAVCPEAREIVPNINRLARALRAAGGVVAWVKTRFTDASLADWSTYFGMLTPARVQKRIESLSPGGKVITQCKCSGNTTHASMRKGCRSRTRRTVLRNRSISRTSRSLPWRSSRFTVKNHVPPGMNARR